MNGNEAMATRRERLEAKVSKRRGWAGKAAAQAKGRFDAAQSMSDVMTGEPIKVGHHSEGRHRRDVERLDNHMRKSVEATKLARHHENKADGLEQQLATTIFSDDPDAIEALETKAKVLEDRRTKYKQENAAFRKHGAAGLVGLGWSATAATKADELCGGRPLHEAYELTNMGAEIRRIRKRIEEVKARQAKLAAAEQAGGVRVERRGDQAIVTFSEPPGRATTEGLRAAGFRWSAPSWYGPAACLPEGIEP